MTTIAASTAAEKRFALDDQSFILTLPVGKVNPRRLSTFGIDGLARLR